MIEELKSKASSLLSEAIDLKKSMDELSEWNSAEEVINNIRSLYDFVMELVLAVEQAAGEITETVGSKDKLEAAVQVLDGMIKLPWYLEPFDGFAFRALISFAVTALNKHDLWPDGLGK